MKRYDITVGEKQKDRITFSANSEQEAATFGAFLLNNHMSKQSKKKKII